jgi:hypothetical protein
MWQKLPFVILNEVINTLWLKETIEEIQWSQNINDENIEALKLWIVFLHYISQEGIQDIKPQLENV